MPSRPLLSDFQELRACSRAALPLRNDQPIHFGPDIALQQMRDAHMQPPDQPNRRVRAFRDKYSVLRSRLQLPHPRGYLTRRRRISQLARKLRDSLRIAAPRLANSDAGSVQVLNPILKCLVSIKEN